MGFKLSMFAVYKGEPGYFGISPKLDQQKSIKLANALPFRFTGKSQVKDLEIWPPKSQVGVGVYEHGALVVHQWLVENPNHVQKHPAYKLMSELFPNGIFIFMGLHSVVNYFGYAVFENGKFIRSYSGAEDHIDAEFGELLPEERPHFEDSYVMDGMRYFKSEEFPDEDLDAPAYGDTLVMDLSVRLFGKRLDDKDFPMPTCDLLYFSRKPWYQFW
jgi:hypothetical protein